MSRGPLTIKAAAQRIAHYPGGGVDPEDPYYTDQDYQAEYGEPWYADAAATPCCGEFLTEDDLPDKCQNPEHDELEDDCPTCEGLGHVCKFCHDPFLGEEY